MDLNKTNVRELTKEEFVNINGGGGRISGWSGQIVAHLANAWDWYCVNCAEKMAMAR